MRAAAIAAHLRHPPAIGAVREDQDLARARHEGAEHGFHGKSAAALERNRDMGSDAARKRHQALSHAAIQRDEIRVARSPIAQHGALGLVRGRERTRGEQVGHCRGHWIRLAVVECHSHRRGAINPIHNIYIL